MCVYVCVCIMCIHIVNVGCTRFEVKYIPGADTGNDPGGPPVAVEAEGRGQKKIVDEGWILKHFLIKVCNNDIMIRHK